MNPLRSAALILLLPVAAGAQDCAVCDRVCRERPSACQDCRDACGFTNKAGPPSPAPARPRRRRTPPRPDFNPDNILIGVKRYEAMTEILSRQADALDREHETLQKSIDEVEDLCRSCDPANKENWANLDKTGKCSQYKDVKESVAHCKTAEFKENLRKQKARAAQAKKKADYCRTVIARISGPLAKLKDDLHHDDWDRRLSRWADENAEQLRKSASDLVDKMPDAAKELKSFSDWIDDLARTVADKFRTAPSKETDSDQ